MAHHVHPRRQLLAIGGGVLFVAALLAAGAAVIPSAAGYAGVGPDFLPWLVAAVLLFCGALLVWQAARGGWRDVEPPSGAERADWRAIAWVLAGVLADAALITTLGFVLACTLCYTLAVRGLRVAEGRPGGGSRQVAFDVAIGLAISAPTYWLFSKVLAISLPALTSGGWI